MLNAMRQSQLAREKARAAFEQQLPAFVDEKYQEADPIVTGKQIGRAHV